MKITVRTPMKANQIRELLENYQSNDVRFRFLSKTGINLEFEAESKQDTDSDMMISLVKSIVRGTDYGKVLNFSVIAS